MCASRAVGFVNAVALHDGWMHGIMRQIFTQIEWRFRLIYICGVLRAGCLRTSRSALIPVVGSLSPCVPCHTVNTLLYSYLFCFHCYRTDSFCYYCIIAAVGNTMFNAHRCRYRQLVGCSHQSHALR